MRLKSKFIRFLGCMAISVEVFRLKIFVRFEEDYASLNKS